MTSWKTTYIGIAKAVVLALTTWLTANGVTLINSVPRVAAYVPMVAMAGSLVYAILTAIDGKVAADAKPEPPPSATSPVDID